MNNDSYTGVQKAAILLITLGPEKAATIFKHLKEDEIEELTLEIANTRSVSPQTKEEVLEEFYQVCLAQQYIAEGGIGYAKELLEKALGNDKAQGVIAKLTASLQVRPFEFIRKTDPAQLLNFIQDEHPQTIAMILSYLAPAQASQVLGALPPEKQADVAKRIATMDRTSPDVIKEVERVLERKLASLVNQDYTIVGGIDAIVGILNSVDRGTEKHIMESLEIEEPELADEIRKKMFVFEDILLLDDRAIQRVLLISDSAHHIFLQNLLLLQIFLVCQAVCHFRLCLQFLFNVQYVLHTINKFCHLKPLSIDQSSNTFFKSSTSSSKANFSSVS